MNRLLIGDCRAVLPTLEAGSVQMVCTSPPYWGLRDYGTAQWEGGSSECDHIEKRSLKRDTNGGMLPAGQGSRGTQSSTASSVLPYRDVCRKCGARRIDAQIGLEARMDCLGWATGQPCGECYVCTMVEVFSLVWQVLDDTGVLFLNLGDSYSGGGRDSYDGSSTNKGNGASRGLARPSCGLKPKDLCGIPWRVALALQADGWYLRSDIIWSKPNPMPESVSDRPTKAHEYLFLLSKRASYYYDGEAIREPHLDVQRVQKEIERQHRRREEGNGYLKTGGELVNHSTKWSGNNEANPAGRNRRSVWEIATEPVPFAHYACFPQKLVEPCVLAGTSERGHCPGCGKRWMRVVEREFVPQPDCPTRLKAGDKGLYFGGWETYPRGTTMVHTRGWQPTCDISCPCVADPLPPIPDVVLDPFAGSNTVGRVAERLGRHWLGIELSEAYGELAKKRTEGITQSIFL